MADSGFPPPRIFSVEEARALIPTVRRLLEQLQHARTELGEAQRRLAERAQGGPRTNGHVEPGGPRDRLQQAVDAAQGELADAVRGIAELGCELKDPDRGMVDFRCLREGRVVYLCWLLEEPTVMFWHELDAGHRGRQRLEE